MIQTLRASQACVREHALFAWSGLFFLSFGAAWLLAATLCEPNTCYWSLAALVSVLGGAALMLTRTPSVTAERTALAETFDGLSLRDWQAVVPADNPYMQPAYLRALERSGTTMRYAVSYREGVPVAAASFQVLDLELDTMLQSTWKLPVRLVLSSLFRRGRARALILGNALHSWTGSFARLGSLPEAEAGRILAELTERVRKAESAGGAIGFTVLRDLELPEADLDRLHEEGYQTLRGMEPTMVVSLDPSWSSPDDYVAAMSRKYRQRTRRARKKGKALERRDLTLSDLVAERATLEPLLHSVVDRASFKLARCSMDDVVELKRNLGDAFVVRSYRVDDVTVGFCAGMAHGGRFEALLVGLDYDVNQELALYQNMLYDFVEMGIERRCETVHLGRTALEIKSTVGAEPKRLPILVRHRRATVNRAVAFAMRFVEAVQWTPRNPFKARQA